MMSPKGEQDGQQLKTSGSSSLGALFLLFGSCLWDGCGSAFHELRRYSVLEEVYWLLLPFVEHQLPDTALYCFMYTFLIEFL